MFAKPQLGHDNVELYEQLEIFERENTYHFFCAAGSGAVPSEVYSEALTKKRQVANGNASFSDLSLSLKLYLAKSGYEFDHAALWQQSDSNKNRNETLISDLLSSGYSSAVVWNSFQHLTLEDQQTYLSRNPNLRLYKQLHTILNHDLFKLPQYQRPQASFMVIFHANPTFVANQLQHDPTLRRNFFYLITTTLHYEFKPLLSMIVNTPALAKDFETELTKKLNPEAQESNKEKPDINMSCFQDEMGRILLHTQLITNAVLTAPAGHFTPSFMAQVALHSNGGIDKYRAAFKSQSWLRNNQIKLYLPRFIAKFFEPALTYETHLAMTVMIHKFDLESHTKPDLFEEHIKFIPSSSNINFIGFKRYITNNPAPLPSPKQVMPKAYTSFFAQNLQDTQDDDTSEIQEFINALLNKP